MTRFEKVARDALIRAIPAPNAERFRDWDDVLDRAGVRYRDAGSRREAAESRAAATNRTETRRLRMSAAVTAAAAAAVFLLVLAWPTDSNKANVLEQALAVVGDGPVVHAVLEDEAAGTLLDLRSGRRTPLRTEREIWFDPTRGVRQVVRLGGVTQSDVTQLPDEITRSERNELVGFAEGYRDALRSGHARLLGPAEVDGAAVYWIRVHSELLPDVGDGRLHEWTQDVAISRDTYKPVYLRETRDGQPSPQTGQRVVLLEGLAAGTGDFNGRANDQGAPVSAGTTGEISVAQVSEILRTPGLWLGPEADGLRLVQVGSLELRAGYSEQTGRWADVARGVQLIYGTLMTDARAQPDFRKPYIVVDEATAPHPALTTGSSRYVPPSGTALVTRGGRSAILQKDGVVVSLRGPEAGIVLDAIQGLHQIGRSVHSR